MDPVDYLIAVRRSWRIIALLTAAGFAAGLLVALLQAPSYRAQTSLLLRPSAVVQEDELGPITSFINSQIHSYSELASSPMVLEAVVTENDLPVNAEELAEQVSSEVPLDTLIIRISVVDSDPAHAADLANSVALRLTDTVSEVAPHDDSDAPAIELVTVGAATPPESAESPRRLLSLTVGAGAGLLLGLLFAVARHGLTFRRDESGAPSP